MPQYKYLILGGGMTADAAAKGIRELDADGTIGLLSTEPDAPYDRPPLTKGMWKGKPREKVFRHTEDKNVTLHLNTRATAIDPAGKKVTDANGNEYTYEKLLIATGGAPTRLPFGQDRVIYYRTLRDYDHLRELADKHDRFIMIGGGYIGSELAAGLTNVGKKVVMILSDETIYGNKIPQGLGKFLNQYYQDKGVILQSEQTATDVQASGDGVVVKTKGVKDEKAHEYTADAVVAGLGIKPNVELAQGAGLQVDNGITVDEHLRTSQPDIYAAGDIANVYKPLLGKRMRIEHEDNSNTMGRAAGRNMAGANEPFTYQPYFYSDLFELGYEAIGELSPKLEMVEDWKEPYKTGIIYYLGDGKVRGVILWNVWGRLEDARKLMAEPGPFAADTVKGKISFESK